MPYSGFSAAVWSRECKIGAAANESASGPVADGYPEDGQLAYQGSALRAPAQHVPSQARRAVASRYVEHDMSQDVVYQWFINSACSSLASPQ